MRKLLLFLSLIFLSQICLAKKANKKNINNLKSEVGTYISTVYRGYSIDSNKTSILIGTGSEKGRYIWLGKCMLIDSSKNYPVKNSSFGTLKKVRVIEKSFVIKYEINTHKFIYCGNDESEFDGDDNYELYEDWEIYKSNNYYTSDRLISPKIKYAWIPIDPAYPIQYTDEVENNEEFSSIGNNLSREDEVRNAIDSIKHYDDSIATRKQFVVDSIAYEVKRIADSVSLLNERHSYYKLLMDKGDYIGAIPVIDEVIKYNVSFLTAIDDKKKCDYLYNSLFIDRINLYIKENNYESAIEYSGTHNNLFTNNSIIKNKLTKSDLELLYFRTVLNRVILTDGSKIKMSLDSVDNLYDKVGKAEKDKYDYLFKHIFVLKKNLRCEEGRNLLIISRYDGADSIVMTMLNENTSSNGTKEPYKVDMTNILQLQNDIFKARVFLAKKDILSTRTGRYCAQLGLNLVSNYVDINDKDASINYFNPNISVGLFRKFGIKQTIYSERKDKFRYKYNMIGIKASISYLDSKISTYSDRPSPSGYYTDIQLSSVIFKTLVLNVGVANNNRFVVSSGFRFSWLDLECKYVFNQTNINDGKFLLQMGVQPNFSFGKKLHKQDVVNINEAVRRQQASILDWRYTEVERHYKYKNHNKVKITGRDFDNGIVLSSIFSSITCVLAASGEYNKAQTSYQEYKDLDQGATQSQVDNKYSEVQNHDRMCQNYLITTASIIAFDIVYGIVRHKINKKKNK